MKHKGVFRLVFTWSKALGTSFNGSSPCIWVKTPSWVLAQRKCLCILAGCVCDSRFTLGSLHLLVSRPDAKGRVNSVFPTPLMPWQQGCYQIIGREFISWVWGSGGWNTLFPQKSVHEKWKTLFSFSGIFHSKWKVFLFLKAITGSAGQ